MAGDQDHRHLGGALAALRQQLQAAGAGQADVGHHRADALAEDRLLGGLGRAEAGHLEAGELQALHGGAAHQFVVFDIDNLQAVRHPVSPNMVRCRDRRG